MAYVKVCSKCKKELNINLFYRDKQKKDKLSSACKNCHLISQRERSEKIREYQNCYRNKNREVVNFREMARYKKKGPSRLFGDKNPNWKGDFVGIIALHNWVRRRKKKTDFCECCKNTKPIDLANISGEYKRDVDDFEWLCRKCHMTKDKRLLNLKQYAL